ncbi:hypothetical protein [Pseudomonas sp. FSL W5-0299]|nr:hypothetical protein [Pseudomonas sp. FSL W5-0299]
MGVGKKVLGLIALLLMLALWASYFYVFKEGNPISVTDRAPMIH